MIARTRGSYNGAVIHVMGTLRLVNSTIVDTRIEPGAEAGQTVQIDIVSTAELHNSIIWGNVRAPLWVAGSSKLTVSHSIVEGGYPGIGNIDSAPKFLGSSEHPYRLLTGSPGIDAADGDVAPAFDLLGHARVDAAVDDVGSGAPPYVDIGAYETQ